jgi:nucleolar complex protein 2
MPSHQAHGKRSRKFLARAAHRSNVRGGESGKKADPGGVGAARRARKERNAEFSRKKALLAKREEREEKAARGRKERPDDVAAWMDRGELAGSGARARVGPSAGEATSAAEFFNAVGASDDDESSGSLSDVPSDVSDLSDASEGDDDAGDSSSGEDDAEAGAGAGAGAEDTENLGHMRRQISQHKRELAELQEQDPEFAEFLRDNGDANLLEFDESEGSESESDDFSDDSGPEDAQGRSASSDSDDEEMDDEAQLRKSVAAKLERLAQGGGDESSSESDSEDDAVATKSAKRSAAESREPAEAEGPTTLRLAEVKRWCEAAANGDAAAVKKLLQGFRAACHMTDPEDVIEREDSRSPHKYAVTSTAVFNTIMSFMLQELPDFLMEQRLLPADCTKATKEAILADPVKHSPNFARLRPVYKSLLGNLLHFMGSLVDDDMSLFVLRALEQRSLLMVFAGFPGYCKKLLKVLLGMWTTANDESVRILAFVCIRALALNMPKPFADVCLKSLYLAFVRNCKFTNAKSMPVVNLMRNCVVELFNAVALDSAPGEDNQSPSAYRHAFVYIRQLAVSLRDAITGKTGDAFQSVYSWQFVHSLRVWTQLLAQLHDQQKSARAMRKKLGLGDMPHLVYPLVQVLFGAASLVPTARFIPLRFHCIDMLHDLAASCNTFLNTLPLLMQILENSTVFGGQLSTQNKKGPAVKKFTNKPTGPKSFDFTVSLKAPKNELNTSNYEIAVATHSALRLLRYFEVFGAHISMPELAWPVVTFLTRWMKQHGSILGASGVRTQSQTRQVLQKALEAIKQQSAIVQARRDAAAPGTFAPRNLERVAQFSSELQQNFEQAAATAATSKRNRRRKQKQGLIESPVVRTATELRKSAGRTGVLGFDSLKDTTVYTPSAGGAALGPDGREGSVDSSSASGTDDESADVSGDDDGSSGSEGSESFDDESMDGSIETDSDGEVIFVPREKKASKKKSSSKKSAKKAAPAAKQRSSKKRNLTELDDDVMEDLDVSKF